MWKGTGLKAKTKEIEEKSEPEWTKPGIAVISVRSTIQPFCWGSKDVTKALCLFFFSTFTT